MILGENISIRVLIESRLENVYFVYLLCGMLNVEIPNLCH